MCGIVGVFGQINAKEETLFKQLLEVDSLRGRHSTGVIKVTTDGIVSTKKKAVDGMDFVKLEGSWITQGLNKVLIGHNRWATKGAVNDVNAHPFSHGHIHGVHNGTLTTQYGLKDNASFVVDSDNIFYDIAHGSIEETVPRLKGAFAIALYNEKEQEVNIFRNSERELAMAFLNKGKTVVIASEFMMLEWCLARTGYLTKEGLPDYELIEMLDTYKNISLKPFAKKKGVLKDIATTMTVNPLEKPKVIVHAAPKPAKKLADFGLNSHDFYPLRLVKEDIPPTSGKNSKDVRMVFEMLCPPFEQSQVTMYTPDSIARIRKMITPDGLIASRLNIPYTKRDTELVSYLADFKVIGEKELNKIEDKPAPKK